MSETERILIQTLKTLENSYEERLTVLSTRLETQEENQILLRAEIRGLKDLFNKLFNEVNAVCDSLQTLLTRLKNGV